MSLRHATIPECYLALSRTIRGLDSMLGRRLDADTLRAGREVLWKLLSPDEKQAVKRELEKVTVMRPPA